MPPFQPITRRFQLQSGVALLAAMSFSGKAQAQSDFDLRIVQGADVDTLDPAVSRSVPSQIVFTGIFNTLIRWTDNKRSSLGPDLAQSWSKTTDGLKWTFKLRPNVKFHDGTAFDAEAVKFNLDRISDPALGSPNRSLFTSIARVGVIDAQTVEVETKAPSPTLLDILAEPYASMNSPAAVRRAGRAYSRHPVGTGPYLLAEWIPGQHVVLKRFPEYFGTPGKPDRITFRPVPEASARVIELEAGNADIALNIAPEAAAQIKQAKAVKLIEEPSTFQVFFELNTTKPPFNDPRVRLAINYAVDRKAVIQQILGGYGQMPEGVFPAGVQGRARQEPYGYDPDRARKILNEVFPGGYKEPIVIWTTAGRYMKDAPVSEAVQSYLNAIGLKTEFKVWEWATYQKTLYQSQPGGTGRGTNAANMWLLGTGVTNADIRLHRKYYSTDASNLTGYNNPKVDALLDKASTEMDYEQRMRLYGVVQGIVWNEDPNALVLFDQVQLLATSAAISGVQVFGDENMKFDQVKRQ